MILWFLYIILSKNTCTDNIDNAFNDWKHRCPLDDRYEMKLLYRKALGDCSEFGLYKDIVYQIKNTVCVVLR